LTFEQKNSLHKPSGCKTSQNNSVGHYIVICGYQDNGVNPNINYMDPYNGTKYSISFNSLLTGFQKAYNGTTQNFSWYESFSFR